MKKSNRRQAIKNLGLISFGALLAPGVVASEKSVAKQLREYFPKAFKNPDRPLTAIVIGAGNRGNVYASFALKYPKELNIIGVAEPIVNKRERFSKAHNIPSENQFVTWEHVFEKQKFADAIIITTPDALHYGPAMDGIPMGYDVICEKVIAQTWKECNDILQAAKKHKNIVAICHVLRYTPYFRKMKEICESSVLGDIVSVEHFEPVEHVHMAHSFVRGNWRNSKESNPMILSKSCHDTDIIRWLVDKPCTSVSSTGGLYHFKKENAPPGSAKRCTDACKIERECPYSALRCYIDLGAHLGHFNLQTGTKEEKMKKLRTGQYGRCVYHCDNDVVDHQLCSFEFEGGTSAAFQMEAFTHYGGRKTRIMGTMGSLTGDSNLLEYMNFRTRKIESWSVAEANITSGHGGGDWGLVRDFIQASSQKNPDLLTSTIEASMESHLMGFMAEESRLDNGTPKKVKL